MGIGQDAAQEDRSWRLASEGAKPSSLVQLGLRFARFRLEHPPGTRYPGELRQAALELLGEVEPAGLYRTCGLSFRQVMGWKEAVRTAAAKSVGFEPPAVRVFSVVDAEPAPAERGRACFP